MTYNTYPPVRLQDQFHLATEIYFITGYLQVSPVDYKNVF